MTHLRRAWAAVLRWFEHGDLVPLLIVVSAAHYTAVLAHHDAAPVAVAIGALVDLGHYRWVRAAARYTGGRMAQRATRWTFALVMTAVSYAYHARYYGGDVWLAAPMPLLIASLAWLAQVDSGRTAQDAKPERSESAAPTPAPLVGAYICRTCGESYATSQALAGHSRSHTRVKRNGHERERVSIEREHGPTAQ